MHSSSINRYHKDVAFKYCDQDRRLIFCTEYSIRTKCIEVKLCFMRVHVHHRFVVIFDKMDLYRTP